jgi:signal-transduction protein with cAMP-binding, CBS, and nucleotidyltransferase domain
MRTVSQLLQNKTISFNTVSQDLLVIEALNQLSSLNISYLVVMQDEEYKGIFSEKDYCRNVILKGLSSNSATVKEVMTSDFPVVSLEDSIEHCLNTMNSFKTRYLLVFDEERFVGVITVHDLLRQVITNKEQVFDVTLAQNLIEADEKCLVY